MVTNIIKAELKMMDTTICAEPTALLGAWKFRRNDFVL